jgi:hypothetical protein
MIGVINMMALVGALFFATQAAIAQNTDNDVSSSETSDYGISLVPSTDKVFASAVVGYDAQKAYSVTVTNAGDEATGALTIALSGADAASFTLSKNSITDIEAGDSDSFTVAPNTELAIGTYSATVTVSGGNDISATFNVSFTVAPVPPVPVFSGLANNYSIGAPVVPLKVIGEGSAALTVFKVNDRIITEFNPAAAGTYLIEAQSANGTLRIWKYVKVN